MSAPSRAPTSDPALAGHLATRDAEFRRTQGDGAADAYLPVLAERSTRYAAHVATLPIPPALAAWALAMTQRFGAYVRVHHYVADWITALLIVRYGEEPDATRTTDGIGWPSALTDLDLARAAELLEGPVGPLGRRWPPFLQVLSVTPSTGALSTGAPSTVSSIEG